MFRVKLAIVIFFFSQGIKSKAQGKDSSKIEIQLFANLGVSSGTQKVENNAIADHLLYFETTYLSGQFIGANIIVWDNWGVTFGIEHKLLPKYVDYEGNFRNDLERKFQSNFFIDARAPCLLYTSPSPRD